MEKALATIAPEGWLPMAAAMLGTVGKPPMWACVGLRPVVGTTVDLKVQPPPLSEREKLLILSCWQQWDPAGIRGSALSQWLLGGTQTLQVSALGRSKAAHEFLVLHYFALDSAKHWEALVSNLLPAVRLPGCFSPSGHCIGNVQGYAYSAFASPYAPCFVDGLHDLDLEPTDGG